MPVTQLRRVEVLFGSVGATEQCFIECTLAAPSSTSESRLAVEVLEPDFHMEIVGSLMLVCGKQRPAVVGIEKSELDAWLDAHETTPGASTYG